MYGRIILKKKKKKIEIDKNTTHKDIKCQISSFLTSIIVHDNNL